MNSGIMAFSSMVITKTIKHRVCLGEKKGSRGISGDPGNHSTSPDFQSKEHEKYMSVTKKSKSQLRKRLQNYIKELSEYSRSQIRYCGFRNDGPF